MSEEQKQEVKKQESKAEVIQPKLCPFVSGFLVEPAKTVVGQMQFMKTTNISPCIEDKCKFYNPAQKDCEICLCFKNLRGETK